MLIQDTDPLGRRPRALPGEPYTAASPALTIGRAHAPSVAGSKLQESRGMDGIFWLEAPEAGPRLPIATSEPLELAPSQPRQAGECRSS